MLPSLEIQRNSAIANSKPHKHQVYGVKNVNQMENVNSSLLFELEQLGKANSLKNYSAELDALKKVLDKKNDRIVLLENIHNTRNKTIKAYKHKISNLEDEIKVLNQDKVHLINESETNIATISHQLNQQKEIDSQLISNLAAQINDLTIKLKSRELEIESIKKLHQKEIMAKNISHHLHLGKITESKEAKIEALKKVHSEEISKIIAMNQFNFENKLAASNHQISNLEADIKLLEKALKQELKQKSKTLLPALKIARDDLVNLKTACFTELTNANQDFQSVLSSICTKFLAKINELEHENITNSARINEFKTREKLWNDEKTELTNQLEVNQQVCRKLEKDLQEEVCRATEIKEFIVHVLENEITELKNEHLKEKDYLTAMYQTENKNYIRKMEHIYNKQIKELKDEIDQLKNKSKRSRDDSRKVN